MRAATRTAPGGAYAEGRASDAEALDAGLQLLLGSNALPMWVYDPATLRFLEVNQAAVDHYGWSRDEFLALTIADIRPPEDLESLHQAVGTAASAGLQTGIYRHRTKSGDLVDVEITSVAAMYGGRPARLVISKDVTRERRAVEALRESEERLRRVFAFAPVGQFTVGSNGEIREANPALAAMTHRPVEDLVGRPWSTILREDDQAPVSGLLQSVFAGHRLHMESEVRLEGGDGEQVDALLTASVVSGADGSTEVVALLVDLTERKAAERQLRRRALHDPLTGLPNRELFVDRLEHGLRRLRRREGLLAVMFLDLDRFKPVNDNFGHAVGDHVLVAIAERLRGVLRPDDTVSRFGGDEFTVLCEEIPDEETIRTIAGRVLEAIAAPLVVDGVQVLLSASVGVAVARNGDVGGETLLRDADAAMYQAKRNGRNRFETFDDHSRARSAARTAMAEELAVALRSDQLRLHFQPVLHLAHDIPVGMEALVRWEHPEKGLVGPLEFIGVAEETGLIGELGAWVLWEACRQAKALPRPEGRPPATVAVNISAKQLATADLFDTIADVLKETGLPPSSLCLEITESVLMENVEASIEALAGLRALGVRLAVDDFGTGYSSLSYLRRFPLDVVKIDRSFVSDVGKDPAADAVVTAIINLSHALGLTVVAEGVETRDQVVALRALGCDNGQGYYWSRPVPMDDFREWETTPRSPTVAPDALDLRGLVMQRGDAMRAATGRSVVLQLSRRLPAALADPGALQTVLDHLLRNAIAYSPAPRPVVVSANGDRRWVRISVTDLGIGMTDEEMARCFEPFWQAKGDDGRPNSGTGTGLYVVRSLVQAMGGNVHVKSSRGKGTTFTVVLPRAPRKPTAMALEQSPDVGQETSIREFMRQLGVSQKQTGSHT